MNVYSDLRILSCIGSQTNWAQTEPCRCLMISRLALTHHPKPLPGAQLLTHFPLLHWLTHYPKPGSEQPRPGSKFNCAEPIRSAWQLWQDSPFGFSTLHRLILTARYFIHLPFPASCSVCLDA